MAHLLVVDDEPTICWGLRKLAEGLGHSVSTAASAEQAFELLNGHAPEVILLDVRLPGMDGLQAMRKFQQRLGPVPIVIMTAYGDLGTAVEAVSGGAFEYLVKPFELDTAQNVLQRALQKSHHSPAGGQGELTRLSAGEGDGLLVGRSPAIQEVFKRIALVAPSTACVHLHGASGTGKELVARAIHRYSRRASGPFVAVNLAALNPTLAESELFGHVRGAFTGAEASRRGLLEQAHQGTIFLDEVADIPPTLQVKLLRSLEHGEVTPVGGDRSVRTDFRLISATHQSLTDQVAAGEFRHDLYFRLSTFQIELPPLRQRPEDIEALAQHFLEMLAKKNEMPQPQLTETTLAELQRRPWHGNVRELRNAVEHALILSRGEPLRPEHLPPPVPSPETGSTSDDETIQTLLKRWTDQQLKRGEPHDLYEQLLSLVEPPFLEVALAQHHHQVATAARALGLHRITLKKKLDQYGIGDS